MACRLYVIFSDLQLKIAHLPVESRRKLSCGERHGKIGKQSDTHHLKVIGKADGTEYRTGAKIDQRSRSKMSVYKIEVGFYLTTEDDTQTMVVDDKRRCLLHNQLEYRGMAMQHSYLIAEIDVFTYSLIMGREDIPHPEDVQQFGLFVHWLSFFGNKDNKNPPQNLFYRKNRTKRTFSHSIG